MINVEEHMGLVSKCAKGFSHKIEYDDAFQQGCLGLIVASKNFKQDSNIKFSTYAVSMINRYIMQYINSKCNMISIPRTVADIRRKITQLENQGLNKGQIIKKLGCTEKQYEEAYYSLTKTVSYNQKLDEDTEMYEVLYDESYEGFEGEIEFRLSLDKLMKKLSRQQKEIIKYRLEGKTQIEIADILGVTRQNVSAHEKKALKKLRESLT